MALVKILKGDTGSVAQVADTDIIEQRQSGRIYTAAAALNPVHQYLMNDGTATSTIADSGTATPYHVTKASGTSPTVTTGIHNDAFRFSSAVEFEGSNPAPTDMIPSGASDQLSVVWWMKLHAATDISDFAGAYLTTASNVSWFLRKGPSAFGNKIYFVYSLNGTATNIVGASTGLTTAGTTWHQIVVTYNAVGNLVNIHVDDDGGITPVDIGGGIFNGGGNNLFKIRHSSSDWEIDQFAIFDRVLSSQEITDLYGSGSGSATENLVGGASDGDVVYINSSSKVESANADADATAKALGFYDAATSTVVAFRGAEITNFNVETAITLAVGNEVFLSDSEAGTITNVAPTTTGSWIIRIGWMEDASTLILDPKEIYKN